MERFDENRKDSKKEIHLGSGSMVMDRYRILEFIDRGGFCYTYRAKDTKLDIEVALKEFFPHGVASRLDGNTVTVFTGSDEMNFEKGKKRFLREARGLAQFNQISGVVSVYDYFEYNSTAYIVMELLKGQNLKKYMAANQGKLNVEFVYDVARKMCEVLKIIHSKGVIHRDISPDNIFLCDDGTLKLIDFGALTQDFDGANSTVTVILKQGYAPFEQYYEDGKQGPWTDIYAFGATLYYLCTGRVPQQSVSRFNQNNLIPPNELNPRISESFSMAIMKAMELRMEDRYQSAEEFENALFAEGRPQGSFSLNNFDDSEQTSLLSQNNSQSAAWQENDEEEHTSLLSQSSGQSADWQENDEDEHTLLLSQSVGQSADWLDDEDEHTSLLTQSNAQPTVRNEEKENETVTISQGVTQSTYYGSNSYNSPENDKPYVAPVYTKENFWTKKKIIVCCCLLAALIGIGSGAAVLLNRRGNTADNTTTSTTNSTTTSTTGDSNKNGKIMKEELDNMFEISPSGVFLFDESWFGQSFDKINEELEKMNLEKMSYLPGHDITIPKQYYVEMQDSRIVLYFTDDKLVGIHYADLKLDFISASMRNVIGTKYGPIYDIWVDDDEKIVECDWEYDETNPYNQSDELIKYQIFVNTGGTVTQVYIYRNTKLWAE